MFLGGLTMHLDFLTCTAAMLVGVVVGTRAWNAWALRRLRRHLGAVTLEFQGKEVGSPPAGSRLHPSPRTPAAPGKALQGRKEPRSPQVAC